MKLLFRHRIHQDIIIILVLFAVTFFIVSKIVVGAGNNASLYLSQAAQWLNGEDFILIKHGGIRGNLFPIIIGVIFKIFGKDVSNATLLINTIFGCSLVLSYFIVRKWLGLAAGLAVPGLILSSNPIISLANTIDTDILIPFLLLSVLFLYHISLTKHNYLFSFLSGLVLGAAILIKESAILYTGFPILILFFRCFGGRLENFYRYLFFLLGTFLLVLPWAISIVAEYGNPLMLLGHATPDHQKYIVAQHTNLSATIKWVRLLTIDFFPTLTIYYTEHLKPVTPFLAPLIPFSWLWVIYNGIKNNSESDLYLFLSALPFLPIVLFVADFHYRIGQTVIIYYLSYFALISLLSKLVDILRIKSRGKWFIKFVENREKTIMLFAVFLILVQLSAVVMDKGFGKIQEKLFGSKDRTIGRF